MLESFLKVAYEELCVFVTLTKKQWWSCIRHSHTQNIQFILFTTWIFSVATDRPCNHYFSSFSDVSTSFSPLSSLYSSAPLFSFFQPSPPYSQPFFTFHLVSFYLGCLPPWVIFQFLQSRSPLFFPLSSSASSLTGPDHPPVFSPPVLYPAVVMQNSLR